MTAFLFDEDHPEMDFMFGPQCASLIIKELESYPNIPAMLLLRGSLLHLRYCYELSEIVLADKNTSDSSISAKSSSQRLSPDTSHLLTNMRFGRNHEFERVESFRKRATKSSRPEEYLGCGCARTTR